MADNSLAIATRTLAVPGRLYGCDVSNLQGDIDWDALADSGITWVYMKEGEDRKIQQPDPYDYFVDGKFAFNWREAKRVGMRRGVYRFVRPTGTSPADSITRMESHIASVGGMESKDFAVCDFEEDAGDDQLQWLSEWLEACSASLILCRGHRDATWLYSGLAYLQRHGCLMAGSTPTQHPYIHASYQKTRPPNPRGYMMRAWQYWDHAQLPGIQGEVDVDVFFGTLDDFDALTIP